LCKFWCNILTFFYNYVFGCLVFQKSAILAPHELAAM